MELISNSSDLPEKNDTSITYYRRVDLKSGKYEPLTNLDDAYKGHYRHMSNVTVQTLQNCPNKCSYRGVCAVQNSQSTCICLSGYSGQACDIEDISFCLNGCNGRGACHRGFCHCTPPYFGSDCSRQAAFELLDLLPANASNTTTLSKPLLSLSRLSLLKSFSLAAAAAAVVEATAAAATKIKPSTPALLTSTGSENIYERSNLNYSVNSTFPSPPLQVKWPTTAQISSYFPQRNRIKVYIYELPTHLLFNVPPSEVSHNRHRLPMAYEKFESLLFRDWAIRTENPYEANLFYIPAFTFTSLWDMPDPSEQLRVAIDYVITNLPFFNRSLGRDHFVWYPSNRDSCSIDNTSPVIRSVMKIVHFGLHFNAHQKDLANVIHVNASDLFNGCFDPKKDVVAPPLVHVSFTQSRQIYAEIEAKKGFVHRSILFFYSGFIPDKQRHSGENVPLDMLTLVQKRYNNDVSIKFINESGTGYKNWMQRATFCLIPYGSGWGIRFAESILLGCIPVLIQDHVWQGFADFIPIHTFAVMLRSDEMQNAIEYLKSYSEAEIAEMRRSLLRHHASFSWNPELQGKAYFYTIKSLTQ
eukprot:CAMPEP_0175038990 /NCGR_PEP_ID=MMETSP0052_2-20121109/248_1 /TAXON_ID=51329 ORGANISM="Polytomella parva, Strain SAG 63-3" /NCGR_SAMPLE_ID=MMETSP0052_2 /ASSEMBLY_ACC=CAM_ASM_000194 /LENGTH=583 /DNA_ID=CAMNT_0016300619 /DNA_START=276 /DNA_END=2023 /DNA_ORIENTATION=+